MSSPRVGVLPADERLGAHDVARAQVRLRLEVDDELVVGERPPGGDRRRGRGAPASSGPAPRCTGTGRAPPSTGRAPRRPGGGACRRRRRARGRPQMPTLASISRSIPITVLGRRECVAQLVGELGRLPRRRCAGRRRRTRRRRDARRCRPRGPPAESAAPDLLEQMVAALMAERVVDLLEAVEVDQEHRRAFPPPGGRRRSSARGDRGRGRGSAAPSGCRGAPDDGSRERAGRGAASPGAGRERAKTKSASSPSAEDGRRPERYSDRRRRRPERRTGTSRRRRPACRRSPERHRHVRLERLLVGPPAPPSLFERADLGLSNVPSMAPFDLVAELVGVRSASGRSRRRSCRRARTAWRGSASPTSTFCLNSRSSWTSRSPARTASRSPPGRACRGGWSGRRRRRATPPPAGLARSVAEWRTKTTTATITITNETAIVAANRWTRRGTPGLRPSRSARSDSCDVRMRVCIGRIRRLSL